MRCIYLISFLMCILHNILLFDGDALDDSTRHKAFGLPIWALALALDLLQFNIIHIDNW